MASLRVIASNLKDLSELASNLVSSMPNSDEEAYPFDVLHQDSPVKSIQANIFFFFWFM